VTEIEKGTYEVEGAERKCDGYQVIIREDDLKKLNSDAFDILMKYANKDMENMIISMRLKLFWERLNNRLIQCMT